MQDVPTIHNIVTLSKSLLKLGDNPACDQMA
jgi:hypothetical protein